MQCVLDNIVAMLNPDFDHYSIKECPHSWKIYTEVFRGKKA